MIRIYHFHNGSGGGVLSVIRNLLKFRQHPQVENHVVYTINQEQYPLYEVPNLEGAASEQVFYYSPKWNFYYTCRQLAKFLPDEQAIVVAHDWLELGMVSNLGLQNPVVQILHGDYEYYYQLAQRHAPWVDKYITIADSISQQLQQKLTERKADITYLRFPVPPSICKGEKNSGSNIIFIGRCTEEKGYPLLPQIAGGLQEKGCTLHWHIVGSIDNQSKEKYHWEASVPVTFYGNQSNEAVNRLLCDMQIFILPSLAEGMPVSLIEAMKAGVIPFVNDLSGGIQELVRNGETGWKVEGNRVEKYVELIGDAIRNPLRIKQISVSAKIQAEALFDPVANTSACEILFIELFNAEKRRKAAYKVYGSRLDQSWIPNQLTAIIRNTFAQ
ncbi:MAG: glycosyltransferase family 4 protein [Saprospiraceae bacterium]